METDKKLTKSEDQTDNVNKCHRIILTSPGMCSQGCKILNTILSQSVFLLCLNPHLAEFLKWNNPPYIFGT